MSAGGVVGLEFHLFEKLLNPNNFPMNFADSAAVIILPPVSGNYRQNSSGLGRTHIHLAGPVQAVWTGPSSGSPSCLPRAAALVGNMDLKTPSPAHGAPAEGNVAQYCWARTGLWDCPRLGCDMGLPVAQRWAGRSTANLTTPNFFNPATKCSPTICTKKAQTNTALICSTTFSEATIFFSHNIPASVS
jgi:hypothetical protein